jgi:hypothetical protein
MKVTNQKELDETIRKGETPEICDNGEYELKGEIYVRVYSSPTIVATDRSVTSTVTMMVFFGVFISVFSFFFDLLFFSFSISDIDLSFMVPSYS